MLSPAPAHEAESAIAAHLSRLFEIHGRMVHSLCCFVLKDLDEAEDVTQLTFLAAYRSLLRGTEPRDPAAWLAVIARNECRAWLRKRPPSAVSLADAGDGSGDPAGLAGQREEIAALGEALAHLPRHQREAFVLREFRGLSYSEIGALLDRSKPAVEAMVFKGRRRLREQLSVLRKGANGFALPLALQSWLTNATHGLPGAPAGSAATGAGAAGLGLAKLISPSLLAKVSAGLLAVGTAASLTAADTRRLSPRLGVQPAPRHVRLASAAESSSPSVTHRRHKTVGRPVPAIHHRGRLASVLTSGSPKHEVSPPTRVSPPHQSTKGAHPKRKTAPVPGARPQTAGPGNAPGKTEGESASPPGATAEPPSSPSEAGTTTIEQPTVTVTVTEQQEATVDEEGASPPEELARGEETDESEGHSHDED